MGKITTENRRALENAKNYDDAVLNGMVNRNFASLLPIKSVKPLTLGMGI